MYPSPPVDDIGPETFSDTSSPVPKLIGVLLVLGLLVAGGWTLVNRSGTTSGWHHTIQGGIDDARQSGRPMLVLFTADWCPPCRRLKRDVLGDPGIAARLQQDYALVKIDLTARDRESSMIAQEAEVQGIPTMILYNRKLLEADRVVGGIPRESFLHWLDGGSRGQFR